MVGVEFVGCGEVKSRTVELSPPWPKKQVNNPFLEFSSAAQLTKMVALETDQSSIFHC